MKSTEIWRHIHTERGELADTLSTLTAEQWAQSSWCTGWSVKDTTSHVLLAAEQTIPNFFKEFAAAGFKFDVFTNKGTKELASLSPDELIRRLKARTTTENHPPGPVLAMLGEIVVHSSDIRRPLELDHHFPVAALIAVADSWKNTNILIGAKRRIGGLRLRATDSEWVHGNGPEVSGPMNSLILAMTGRKQVHGDLAGDGLATLASRP